MGARVMALQEQAEELGYGTIQEALDAGYEVSYRASGDHKLYKPDEQELAHREWLKEKEYKLKTLRLTAELCRNSDMPNTADDLEAIADFFEKGEV